MMLGPCDAAVSDSTTVQDHMTGRTAIVATGLLVVTVVLHLPLEVDDRGPNAMAMVALDRYSLHKVVKLRATKTSMPLAEVAVVS